MTLCDELTRLRLVGRHPFITAALVALTMLAAEGVLSASENAKQVLVLYSTRRDSVLAGVGDRELSRLLNEGLARKLDYYTEYIDETRFPDERYQAGFGNFLRLKYQEQHFDVVIAMEEASLEFADKVRNELFPGTPVVFFALNPRTRRIPNSTGVFAELAFLRTINLACALQPDIEQLFLVSGAAPRDKMYEELARRRLQSLDGLPKVTYLSGLSIEKLEARVADLPPRSAIYYLLVSQDGSGVNLPPLDYLDRLAGIANRPIYSWDDSTMGHGVVGGSLRHLESGIALLAQQALRVLRGESADDIPTSAPDLNVLQVDWRELRRWNIDDRIVPVGTSVQFREFSIWRRYRAYLFGALVLLAAQTALIAGLLIQGTRRRRAEEQVRGSEAGLRTSYARIRDLAGRLLSAQDIERSRIARDLHDDISQQLALLSIDLQLLSGVCEKQGQDPDELARVALERTGLPGACTACRTAFIQPSCS